jgi:SAM-dependent methyltransferase
VGGAARERLLELAEKRGRKRVTKPAPKPPVPVPPEWFDADYFEFGRKSNWRSGYHWSRFEGLFRDTARFLVEMFPAAHSFLDCGCAKGFLVRALRESGSEAFGFDASAFAVSKAPEELQAFLRVATTGKAKYDRRFDMLVAFDLLQMLSEDQVTEFLRRSRKWTSQGILAVIPVSLSEGNLDRAQITIRPRDWWREQFLAAGWKQGPLDQALESACRRHPLPSAMNWELFLFAA